MLCLLCGGIIKDLEEEIMKKMGGVKTIKKPAASKTRGDDDGSEQGGEEELKWKKIKMVEKKNFDM